MWWGGGWFCDLTVAMLVQANCGHLGRVRHTYHLPLVWSSNRAAADGAFHLFFRQLRLMLLVGMLLAVRPNGRECEGRLPTAGVQALVGLADAIDLKALPDFELVQLGCWYPIESSAVPETAAMANFDIWPDPWYQNYSVSNLGEFVVAAIFHDTYGFAHRSKAFLECAFGADAPARCEAGAAATEHKTISALTTGMLGPKRTRNGVSGRYGGYFRVRIFADLLTVSVIA